MHAPPRDRLFVLLTSVATVVGLLLASDDAHWMATCLCLTLAAAVLSLLARGVGDERVEQAAALAWWMAIVVGARWISVPAVWVPLAGVTIGGLPFVIAMEVRGRRAEIRSAQARCVACGYDLRATAERCPECGTAINPEVERLRRIAAEMRAVRAGGGDPTFRRPTFGPAAFRPASPAGATRRSPAASDATDAPR